MTIREAIDQAISALLMGSAWDYALPQAWVDDVFKVTGVYPTYFVWWYPNEGWGHIYGLPFPVSGEAVQLLDRYNSIRKSGDTGG